MEARMHSLEDALAIVHATSSNHPHPLLQAPEGDNDEDYDDSEPRLKPIDEEPAGSASCLADGLGTLFIDDHGSSRFFGRSGGSEVCTLFDLFMCERIPNLLFDRVY